MQETGAMETLLEATFNLHPIFVHFPIALWPTAVLFLATGILRDQPPIWRAGCWLLHLGTLAAIATIATGYIAADQLGHDTPGHDLVHTHRDIMIAAASCSALTSVAVLLTRERLTRGIQWGLLLLACTATLVAMVGADRGGEMVYRYSIGTLGQALPGAGGHDHGEHEH
jgi:uncharacterized membrane protein